MAIKTEGEIHDCFLWATPDHVIMHVQFSSGVTNWQRVLKTVVNTLHIHGNSVNKWCTNSSQEIVFLLTLEFLLTKSDIILFLSEF